MYGQGNDRGGRFGGPRRTFAPVQAGEELDVRIEAVGEKGDGIARKKGFVLFVPNTKEGEEVRIRVTKVLRKVGFAEVVGPAQGSVEEDEGGAPAQEPQPVAQPEPAPDAPEDTEDFGEEPAPAAEEAPAEEPAAEEPLPAEEPAPEPAAEEPAPEPEAPAAEEPAPEAPAESMDVPPPPPAEGEESAEEKKEEAEAQ